MSSAAAAAGVGERGKAEVRLADGDEDDSSASGSRSSNSDATSRGGAASATGANISRIPTNANLALEETGSRDGREGWLHRAQVPVGQRNGAGPPLPAPPKELTHHAVGSSRVSEERI